MTNRLSSRFDDGLREDDCDWLDDRVALDEAQDRVPTSVTIESARSAITYNSSPDIGFDRSINAYRGCEHGCIYCFARPTHAYLNLSPGMDFESRLFAKPDAPEILRRELASTRYQVRPIALGTNTDPYQPIEAHYRITRGILDVLLEHDHPVTITTKSSRVTRDIDILARLAEKNLAAVVLSVTSLNPRLASILEPRASTPSRRIDAIRQLSEAGIPVSVGVSPIIPAITDHEIEAIVEAAAAAGAKGAFSLVVRLPYEVSPLFRAWLAEHFPDRQKKVMHLIQEMRGGADNVGEFFERFRPKGAYAAMLHTRFRNACRKHGLDGLKLSLRTDLFRRPGGEQLSLL